ncbi:glycoside hydrolase family 75 protein [Streptomyces sp. JHA26]|uniref:glycoside hydrolase family 75 protein n=1 Tax=Streptomyces sp. JHA26 TaxID=1917143 RepID=UPI00098BC58B|nr:glycoside hydrolase family 75 protein [Streptomyces sp. JHA26]
MRVQSLTLVAASAALIAPTTFPVAPLPSRPGPQSQARPAPEAGPRPPAATGPEAVSRLRPEPRAGSRSGVRPPVPGPDAGARTADGTSGKPVRAADLLARTRHCTPVSHGRYRSDAGAPADIPVCGTRDAVFWKADLDIDCDGRSGDRCNARTDPHFTAATAYTRSGGGPLDAEKLPYVVVPRPSGIWNHRADGVHGGSVVALVHGDRVGYAVVGDIGPRDVIGEASYAAAEALGVPADPRTGGVASGVTYILFKNTGTEPIEDTAATERTGERLAREFADGD